MNCYNLPTNDLMYVKSRYAWYHFALLYPYLSFGLLITVSLTLNEKYLPTYTLFLRLNYTNLSGFILVKL